MNKSSLLNRFFSVSLLLSGVFIAPVAYAQVIDVFSGAGGTGFSGDGGPAYYAGLQGPAAFTIAPSGNMYIADADNHRIRKINTAGNISTIAGNGTSGFGGDGGAALSAMMQAPGGVAEDASGNVYFSDVSNHRVRKINTSGIISTIAGTGTMGFSGDGGPATAANLQAPKALEFDAAGNLYIADYNNSRVRMITPAGTISTFAGGGTGGDGGPASAASLGTVNDIHFDAAGNLFIAADNMIRKVNTSGIISTVAGFTSSPGYSGDGGPATAAQFNIIYGVTTDAAGNIYIADGFNYRVRKVSTSGIITTFAGTGTGGACCYGGPATDAQLNPPSDVVVNSANEVFIVDVLNDRIMKTCNKANAGIISGPDSVCVGRTITLTSSVTGGNWFSEGPTLATVSATGVVTGLMNSSLNIYYRVTNSCAPDTAAKLIYVKSGGTCPAGIAQVSGSGSESLTVSPNPSTGSFVVNVNSAGDDEAVVMVYNLVGVKIKEYKVRTNTDKEINLSVPPGIYIINTITKGEKLQTKMLVE